MSCFVRWSCLRLLLISIVCVGCESNHYELELEPQGKSLSRKLTVWRDRSQNDERVAIPFPAKELRQIASQYATKGSRKELRHFFRGEFSAQMPQDVGGSGSYLQWESPLGSMSVYVERFRSDDDLVAALEKRKQAMRHLADLVTQWLTSELRTEPGFAKLDEFLRDDFRRDMQNVLLYVWTFGLAGSDDERTGEGLIRVGQYLAERGYFEIEQIPAFARALQEENGRALQPLLQTMRRFVATKMGFAANAELPSSLDFLKDADTSHASINRALRSNENHQQRLTEWRANRKSNPELAKPEPVEALAELAFDALLPGLANLFGGSDHLNVRLSVATKPFATNGKWDQDSRRVTWETRIRATTDSEESTFPQVMYALWSKANEVNQRRHFGKVLLKGEDLAAYSLWYRALSKAESRQWDTFVNGLEPGPTLPASLQRFRFENDRNRDPDEGGDLASTPRKLLTSALGGVD